MQDETKKDSEDKLVTIIVADSDCLIVSIKTQSGINDRKADGIADTQKEIIKSYKEDGCKLFLYTTDSCNTMRKARNLVVATENCFAGGCMIHVEQNVAIFIIGQDVFGFKVGM